MDKKIMIIIAVVVLLVCISSSVGAYFMMSGGEETPVASTPAPAASSTASSPASPPPAASTPPPTPPPPPPKFTLGISKNSGFNDEGSGNTVYLDRHNITCDSNGIKRFRLVRDGQGKYRYDYTCMSGGDLGSSTSKNTGFNDEGNGNVVYLDRHNIDCGSNSVLSQFKLNRSGQNQYRYDYSCLSSNKPLQCRSVTTQGNDDGGGNAVYLDRHDINCNDDETLSQFKLTRPTGNTIQYQYKCCKY